MDNDHNLALTMSLDGESGAITVMVRSSSTVSWWIPGGEGGANSP